MFKSGRWRSEKNKVKAVFELQFQATQVPVIKRKKTLMVSLVPDNVGKPTARLHKAAIVEGTCTWENPIYETVKLIREAKTGNYKENIYHFVVSTGSSKSGFLGEVSLDFAEFAEATQPLLVSLPLNYSDSGAILHICIQKMQGTENQRDVEENEDSRTTSLDRSLENQLVDSNKYGSNDLDFIEDEHLQITSPDTERNSSFNDPQLESTTEKHMHERSNTDWSTCSASDRNMVDSTSSPEENFPRNRSREASNDSIEILKSEISILERQAEMSELELQSLRKQIAKESRRAQELSREIVTLKEERIAPKTEYKQLKSSQKCIGEAEPSDEIRQQLQQEKDLNKKLKLRMYKTEDSNSELILVVSDLNRKLEEKSLEILQLSSTIEAFQNVQQNASKSFVYDMDQDKDKRALEELYDEIEVYRKDKEELKMHMDQLVVDYDILKEENRNISTKLDQNQIEQMKIKSEYSESLATIEDLKLQVQLLEKELNEQGLEFSNCLHTMNELESQIESLEKQLEKQARAFEDDLEAMTQAKVGQEQRAIRAEETLRKTRWNNANAAERLQDEFRRLSEDMATKFQETERVSTKAVAEAADLRLQTIVLEEMLQKSDEEFRALKDQYEGKLQELLNQTNLQAKKIEQMSQELEDKHNQIESFHEEEEKMLTGKSEILKRWSKEREELERELSSSAKEVETLKGELSNFRTLENEKEILVGSLQSEVENLSSQYNELKHCMLQIDLEKETLRKQVSELEGKLKKKDEIITSMDKKIESNGEHAANSDIRGMTFKDAISSLLPYSSKNIISSAEKTKSLEEPTHAMKLEGREIIGENLHQPEMKPIVGMWRQNEVVRMTVESEIDTPSDKDLKVSTRDTSDNSDLTKLSSEVASLKERNKHMEGELKEMQDKYSEISLRFAEVEGERQQLVMSLRNLKNGKKK